MTVKLVKLASADEIFCEVEHNDHKSTLVNPISLVNTQTGMAFARFLPYAKYDTSIEVLSSNIVLELEVDIHLEKAYNEAIETIRRQQAGLIVPEQKIITE